MRLARHQGLLSGADLNPFQKWALRYSVHMDRRVELRDREDALQRLTWYLEPSRYRDLFLAGVFDDPESPADDEADGGEGVNDVDELDRYFDRLEARRTMTGEMLDAALGAGDGGWL